jgi:predicted DNA-binding protein
MNENAHLMIYNTDPEFRDRVDRWAEAQGRTRSGQLRWVIERELDDWEQQRAAELQERGVNVARESVARLAAGSKEA